MSGLGPEVWRRLAGSQPSADGLIARRVDVDLTDRLFAAIDGDGHRHLLVPLLPGEATLVDDESRGINVNARDLALPDRSFGTYLDIVCNDAAGHEAFDLIGREIGAALSARVLVPATALSRILSKWRRFWGQIPRTQLTREEQLGLFAEIWFLLRWLYPVTGPLTAATRWRGPFASRHDFESLGRAVEVKASTVVRGPVFRINGLDQLDPPAGCELLFFALRLREDRSSGTSLPALIAETRASLEVDGEALTQFEIALVRTGYSPAHESDYAQALWRVVDERLYSVDAGFPRLSLQLLASGLPPGVSEIGYTLDLSGYTGTAIRQPPDAVQLLT